MVHGAFIQGERGVCVHASALLGVSLWFSECRLLVCQWGFGQSAKQPQKAPASRCTHISKHNTDKSIQRNPENVDDCCPQRLWHARRAQRHHAWPKDTNAGFKHAEGKQLHCTCHAKRCTLAACSDA